MPDDVIYLTEDFEPVSKDDPRVTMVKVRMSDGRIVFGFPEQETKKNQLFHSGGKGSGHFGHSGREGLVGGSNRGGVTQLGKDEIDQMYYHRSFSGNTDAILRSGYIKGSEDNFADSVYVNVSGILDYSIVFGVDKSHLHNFHTTFTTNTASNLSNLSLKKVSILVYESETRNLFDVTGAYRSGIKTEAGLLEYFRNRK